MLVHTQNAKVIWIAYFSRTLVGELLARFTKLSSVKMYPSLAARETYVVETNFAARKQENTFASGQKHLLPGHKFYFRNIHVCFSSLPNLVPRVLRLFGQRLVARRDSGELEFYYRRIYAIKQCKPLRGSQSKNLNKFQFPRVSPGD